MNTKMKVLSLALLGLVGYAGSAAAGCPASPVPPWSSAPALSGGAVTIATGGLDASACHMEASLGASFASLASVIDTTPANEPRYRFQFLINADALGTFGPTDGVSIFSANAAAPANGRTPILQVGLVPGAGGAQRLVFIASCAGGANFRCATQTADLAAGTHRVEVDVQIGAAVTTMKYWLDQTGTTEPAETGLIAVTGGNDAWNGGVDTATMGLGGPTPSYIGASGHVGQAVSFDTFDSRRTTYIGS